MVPFALFGVALAQPQPDATIVYMVDPAMNMVMGHPVGSDRLVPISGATAIMASTVVHLTEDLVVY
jgi:hypothetical protein